MRNSRFPAYRLIAVAAAIGLFVAAGAVVKAPSAAWGQPVLAAWTSSSGVAAPDESASAPVKGSDRKGKYYYKKECRVCHGKNGKGEELTPMSKTIRQWERFFRKDRHGDKKLSEEFDPVHLIHIRTFLTNHAADSDQPETCG